MGGKIYHPEDKHPEPYQTDLNPNASAGLNYGLEGADIPKRTAIDIKEFHEYLNDFTNDELRQIPVLKDGAHLETKAAYINLADERPHEIQAMRVSRLLSTTTTSRRRTSRISFGISSWNVLTFQSRSKKSRELRHASQATADQQATF